MQWKDRGLAAGVHFIGSGLIALLAAWLVFGIWFPHPYRHVSGGLELFGLVVSVDLLLGPVLTLCVFNRAKPRRELFLDLSVIVLLQMAALAYGLVTVFQARPVYLVHEVDRFQVVTAADVDPLELAKAAPEFQKLPLHGVRMIGVRKSQSLDEMMKSVESALAGKDVARMPERWQVLDATHQAQMQERGRDAAFLRSRATDGGVALDGLLAQAGLNAAEVIGLPLVSRRSDWTVLLKRSDLSIVGYLPIESF